MSLRIPYGALRRLVYALLLIAAPASAAERDVHVLALGDSLTAGYGLPPGLGFAPQLQAALRRNGLRAFVADAGVSGNTAAQGRARLAWTLAGLRSKPDLAIVALGANDMLRGLPPAQTRADLDAILAELGRRGIPVLVAGMRAAPNLGADYRRDYEAIFPELSRRHGAALYPFFLAGVAGNASLALPDGMHPNFRGIKIMVAGITPTVLKALGR
ncbi:MAG TPA: arylesterase [Allosphingosinicella sp.]|jgi:acyl-CoA thioesterase-1